MLCSDDAAATYTISDIALEYDVNHQCCVYRKGLCSSARDFIPVYKGDKTVLPTSYRRKILPGCSILSCRQRAYKACSWCSWRIKQILHTRLRTSTTHNQESQRELTGTHISSSRDQSYLATCTKRFGKKFLTKKTLMSHSKNT